VATILLVRHGETDWNRLHRFQGHADPGLNEAGRAQSAALAERLPGRLIAALYSSPLRRAMETGRILGVPLGLLPVAVAGLAEVDVGSWTGLTRNQVEQRFPAGYSRWLEGGEGWEDGETFDELAERTRAALAALAAAHDGETILVVTHGGPIRVVLASASGIDLAEQRRTSGPIANCAVYEMAVENGTFRHKDREGRRGSGYPFSSTSTNANS
jgi:broad specificity phosphatase PhoE